MYLNELQSITNGSLIGDAFFEGIATHTDMVRPGNLFVCLEGAHFDAHTVADVAVQRGAAALVCGRLLPLDVPQLVVSDTHGALSRIAAHYYHVNEIGLCLVGVTGTNGKTSTAFMLQRIAACAGLPSAYIGTLGVVADKYILPPTLTTPDPLDLMPLLADLAARGVRYVFLEVSAHAAYWHKVDGLRFSCMVFTNLTQDHLDFFADMQAYAEAKRQLFSRFYAPCAVLNMDDPFGREIASNTDMRVVGYGLTNPAEVFAVNVKDTSDGLRFVVNADDHLLSVDSVLHGTFNVYNALAAIAVCAQVGIPLHAVAVGLKNIFIPGRFNVVDIGEVRFIVDYAHTPDGLAASIDAARALTRGKLTVVFGCGGDRDRDKRASMGSIAAEGADRVYITNDNPRGENPAMIAAGIEAGMSMDVDYCILLDRAEAIKDAYRRSQAGDCVLIAGKGAENTMEIDGTKVPYSDFAVLESLK